ncbi:MAG: PD-(D/E)XK nuclease family protein [Chloroflexi bacterium]|nr:PD-(D/E)XK nuclease family protein [Chloroflexota bacterium]
MTISLLFGASDSGRTEALLIAACAHSGRARIVTASVAQRDELLLRRDCKAAGVTVQTFEQICEDTLEAAFARKIERLPAAARGRFMDASIALTDLKHFAPLRGMPGFAQALLRLRFELHAAGVETTDMRSISVEPRLLELVHILDAYDALLVTGDWYDSVRLARDAITALDASPMLLREWSWLALDGFDEFTIPQREWLRRVAVRVGECVVTTIGWDDDARVQLPRLARVRGELSRALDVAARSMPLSYISPLAELGDAIARGDLHARESLRGRVHLLEAPDASAEVRAALRWIKQQHLREDTPFDRMALLARDMSAYATAIRSIADEMEIPIVIAGGAALTSNPAVAALLDLLRACVSSSPTSEPLLTPRLLVDAWRSPYFDLSKFGITAADAFALDTAARRGHVIQGRAQWEEALSLHADSQEADSQEMDEDVATAATSPHLHACFTAFTARFTSSATSSLRAFVEWMKLLIDDLCIRSRAEMPGEFAARDSAALMQLTHVLDGLLWTEEKLGAHTTAAPFDEVRRAIAGASYEVEVSGDFVALSVLDVTQVGGLHFDMVAVLGLAEGRFPAAIREDAFLRDADRRMLNECCGAHLSVSTTGVERDWFYVAATRARHAVLFTRPRIADGGVEWQASPYWDELCRIVSDAPVTLTSADRPAIAEAASLSELVQIAAHGAGPQLCAWFDRRAPHVLSWLAAGARIVAERSVGGSAATDGDLSSLAGALAQRYDSQHLWSASAFEEYHACPHRFYFGRVLALQPRPMAQTGPDAAALGRLYHTLFERAYREAKDSADPAVVRASLDRIADDVFDAAYGFRAAPWWPQTRRDILANVRMSIDASADSSWIPTYFELRFRDLPVCADGETLLLQGRIDRIDVDPNGALRVIDYKPGSPLGYGSNDLVAGRRLQLPFYAHAAAQIFSPSRVSDAFHFHYLYAEPGRFRLSKFDGGIAGAFENASTAAVLDARNVRAGKFAPFAPEGGCPEYCPAAGFCWSYTR